MSVQDAKTFVKKLATDPDFRKRVEEAPNDEERRKIVKGMGLNFSKEELNEVLPGAASGKIREEDLAGVAGGTSGTWVAVALGAAAAAAAAL
jgi:predicted ribosomally synthesized peptide with nif11-like leader